ncbi:hypothetical protein GCM10009702_05620 [Propioniferax innocua]
MELLMPGGPWREPAESDRSECGANGSSDFDRPGSPGAVPAFPFPVASWGPRSIVTAARQSRNCTVFPGPGGASAKGSLSNFSALVASIIVGTGPWGALWLPWKQCFTMVKFDASNFIVSLLEVCRGMM